MVAVFQPFAGSNEILRMGMRHLDRYESEFSRRHNAQVLDTLVPMNALAVSLMGKWLRYQGLIGR